jgi:hypothetical protein
MHLDRTIHVGLAGDVNSGKTMQALSAFNMTIEDDDGNVSHPFRPALYIAIGGDSMSAAGTASAMLSDPDCVFIHAGTIDDIEQAFRVKIPEGHPTRGAYRMVVIDSWSSVKNVVIAHIQQKTIDDGGSTSLSGGKGDRSKLLAYNSYDMGNAAQPTVSRLFGHARAEITRTDAPPRLFISMCHIDDKTDKVAGNDVRVGTQLAVSKSIRMQLWMCINIMWLMHRDDPDMSNIPAAKVNEAWASGQLVTNYYALTLRGNQPMMRSAQYKQVDFIKRQTEGHMAPFGLVPPVWSNPTIGLPLALMIAESHGSVATQTGSYAWKMNRK